VGTDTRRQGQRPKKARMERVLLIALSPAREKLLLEEPELVSAIVHERAKTAIPRSVEFDERFISLQKALCDFASKSGMPQGQGEALTPRNGTLLYEDDTIHAALLVGTEQAHTLARWVAALPASFGARSTFEKDIGRLQRFYSELAGLGHALLSIRFSE
jgi:hypothetical protein